jgi:hypothetical protein
MKEKISVSLDEDLIREIDRRTSNRSGFITRVLKEKLSTEPSIQSLLSEIIDEHGKLIYWMRDALGFIKSVIDKAELEGRELTPNEMRDIRELINDFTNSLDAFEKGRIIEKRALQLVFHEPRKTEKKLAFEDLKLSHIMQAIRRTKEDARDG